MSFPSVTFLVFFAVTLLVYYLVPKSAQWVVLLIASTIFYAAAGGWYLPFILTTIVTTFGAGRLIDRHIRRSKETLAAHRAEWSSDERKAFKKQQKRRRRPILILGLVLNFGILAVLKYTGFTLTLVNGMLSWFGGGEVTIPSLILPLGISFYTFRSTAYLIDVYREKAEAAVNPAKFALFVSFFPAIIQGPISRYNDLAPQFFTPHRAEWSHMAPGFLRMLWGYFKKLVVADTVMVAVKAIVQKPDEFGGMYVVLLIFLYSAVIYGDFTGGIDITIGCARMMGLVLEENFRHPFSSRNTEEYWKRWHITMGSWFQNYVFYPMSISGGVTRFTKRCQGFFARHGHEKLAQSVKRKLPVYLCTVVTWFLTGLWHGASWNFIVWGLLNGAIILISNDLKPLYKRFHARFPRLNDSAVYGGFCAARTFVLMGIIRILDCYRDVPVTARALWSSVTVWGNWSELFNGQALERLGVSIGSWIVVGLSIILIFFVSRAGKKQPVADRLAEKPILYSAACAGLTAVILLFGSYGIGFNAGDFIYGIF